MHGQDNFLCLQFDELGPADYCGFTSDFVDSEVEIADFATCDLAFSTFLRLCVEKQCEVLRRDRLRIAARGALRGAHGDAAALH